MRHTISVIGGANIDISADLTANFVHADSIPGQVSLGYGGVARNIAHNLSLLGNDVQFISVFGDDVFGDLCFDYCRLIPLDLSMSERISGSRNGLYLCINDQSGDMVAAVADTAIIQHITPDFLRGRIDRISESAAVVADANLSASALSYLFRSCEAPLFVDAVSTNKAMRIMEALEHSLSPRNLTLKLNQAEALAITNCTAVDNAAAVLLKMGVQHVFVTLGSDGVMCCDAARSERVPAITTQVINTTGAGDAFLAGVVHAFVNGLGSNESAGFGLRTAHATLQTHQAVNPEISKLSF